MSYFKSFDDSANLVQGMAERLGVDLTPNDQGLTLGTSFRSMVLACTGCSAQGSCKSLQAAKAQLEQAPDYCRNGARFAVAKAG